MYLGIICYTSGYFSDLSNNSTLPLSCPYTASYMVLFFFEHLIFLFSKIYSILVNQIFSVAASLFHVLNMNFTNFTISYFLLSIILHFLAKEKLMDACMHHKNQYPKGFFFFYNSI